MTLHEALLHRAERSTRGSQALDRDDLGPVGLDGEHQAGADRLSVTQHRASPANAMLTADVRAGQAAVFAQEIRQQPATLHGPSVVAAVDLHRDLRNGHRAPPAQPGFSRARTSAIRTTRAASGPATRRR